MIEPLVRIALACAVAILAGLPLVASGRRPDAGDLAAAWALALGNTAVLALAAGLLGLTLSPAVLLLLLIAPGAAAAALARGSHGRPALRREGGEPRVLAPAGLVLLSRIALACALAALLVKLVQIPLWSWDHYAIWGIKARSMLVDGHLRLDFLRSLYQTRTDHPLGVPMAWLVLTLGEAPSPAAFKALHALFALALVAVLHAAVRRVSSSTPLANAAAPLLWDSEAVGLAEVPLALWAMVSLLWVSRAIAAARRRAWMPGLVLGLCWAWRCCPATAGAWRNWPRAAAASPPS